MDSQRLHAIVTGYVQGVGYRMFVIQQARRLDLMGWVRNRSDGAVELVAEGLAADLHELLRMLRDGPHQGSVSEIDSQFSSPSGEYKQFWFLETC